VASRPAVGKAERLEEVCVKRLASVCLAAFAVSVAAVVAQRGSAAMQTQPARPNIVFILSDDEDLALHEFMPKTKALLHQQGTTFSNYFVTFSLCCPSRSTTLTGEYPHNTKVESNQLPTGGFERAFSVGLEKSTIATWLHAAGYHTMLAGKYLNGYGAPATTVTTPTYVPPGWDEWYGGVGGAPYQDFRYQLNENGRLVRYAASPQDYLTDVIARKAVATIRTAVAARKPFFLYLAPFTPHAPATPAPRHEALFANSRLPRTPSFNEQDVSDKPAKIRNLGRLGPPKVNRLEALYRKRLQSLQAIDDLVETIINALQATGQLNNTYIVYASDNGFHMGQHRLMQGKTYAYEEDVRVPFVIRGPGVPAGKSVSAMVLNNDLAPSFAEMAGVSPPATVDGRSFLPLLRDPTIPWRQSFMVELRGAQAEEGEEDPGGPPGGYNAIRTSAYTYIEWAGGEREFYDLAKDPFELTSTAKSANASLISALSTRLAALAKCVGAECKRLEDGSVPK
jgi:arylsulfatase A-like enzyme